MIAPLRATPTLVLGLAAAAFSLGACGGGLTEGEGGRRGHAGRRARDSTATLVNEEGATVFDATSLGGTAYWREIGKGGDGGVNLPVAVESAPLLGGAVTFIANFSPAQHFGTQIGVTSSTVFLGAGFALFDFPPSGVPAGGPAQVDAGPPRRAAEPLPWSRATPAPPPSRPMPPPSTGVTRRGEHRQVSAGPLTVPDTATSCCTARSRSP